jgi:hypothetical protein
LTLSFYYAKIWMVEKDVLRPVITRTSFDPQPVRAGGEGAALAG